MPQSKSLAKPLAKKVLLKAYEDMLTIRRFEEKAAALYQQGLVGGFLHLYIGQEAVLVGAKLAAQEDDDYITSYRCHAHAIMCGVPLEAIMSELTGRATGISKGKGGSMHMFDPDKHFWGGHGIVAAQVPLGAGIAFANKYKQQKNVCLTFTGDGAMNAGQVFETLNMAAVWELPMLLVIENNHYSMGTTVERASAGEFYKRGECFGIPGVKADGQDIFEVHKAMETALKYVREEQKPYILELDTYRYRGHSMSDPGKYRTRDEVDTVRENRDPIGMLHNHLVDKEGVTAAELQALDRTIKDRINAVAAFAESAPIPSMDELWTDVTVPEGK